MWILENNLAIDAQKRLVKYSCLLIEKFNKKNKDWYPNMFVEMLFITVKN